jgi:hypothetical protein
MDDVISTYKAALEATQTELDLYKRKTQSQADYIALIEKQRDAAINAQASAAPGWIHDLSCGMVGAAAGVVLTRGFR